MLVMFFFKQKTAYDMRISDWSSYVCSSDLLRREVGSKHTCQLVNARLCCAIRVGAIGTTAPERANGPNVDDPRRIAGLGRSFQFGQQGLDEKERRTQI